MRQWFLFAARTWATMLLVCMGALATAPPSHAQRLDPPAFTAELAKALKAAAPKATISVAGDLELRIKTEDGRDVTLFLANAHAEYQRDPKAIPKIVDRHVASLLKPRQQRAAGLDRSRVVPVVKDKAWLLDFEKVQREATGKKTAALFEELNEELVIVYAEDTPTRTRYLNADEFDAIGVERKALREFAVKNLASVLPKINLISGAPVQSLTADGDYDASLLLFDHIWSSGQIKVAGDIVVAIPARDMLLITGSRDKEGMAGLRAMAAKYIKERPHRLTDKLFLYRQGRFYPLPSG